MEEGFSNVGGPRPSLLYAPPSWLTGPARRARAALGAPAPALATAAIVEGEGGSGQGAHTHAVLSALAPAHFASLRGTLCGVGPVHQEEARGRDRPPPFHPTESGTAARGSTRRAGPRNVPSPTVALTRRALGELAVLAGGPGHPGRVTLAAVGAR
jgi:hypothetical protein